MKSLTDIFLSYQKEFFLNSKKRKIWISSRQVGKSFTIAGLLCYKALLKDNGLSLCVSVNSRSASEILKKCAQFAEAVKTLSDGKITYTASFDSIKFSNGSRVLSLPSTSDSLRGFSAQCVCIDEAAFVWRLDEILQAIGPTLTRDPNAELVLTTTPAGKNGDFYDLYQRSLDDDSWYVQTTTIHDAIAAGLKVDLDALHTLCPDEDVFKQEYECCFSDEFGSMIDINDLDFYEDDITGQDGMYFSADIGRTNDRSAIVITKTKKDQIYVDDIILLNKCEYQKQLDIFKSLNDTYHFNAGYIDAGGIGSAVAEFANKQISAKIKPYCFTGTNKTPAYEAVRDKIFQKKLHFNKKFKSLVEQDFRNVSRIVTETGAVKFQAGRDDQGHSDFVSSLVLNIQAIVANPVSFSMPQGYMRSSAFGMRSRSF